MELCKNDQVHKNAKYTKNQHGSRNRKTILRLLDAFGLLLYKEYNLKKFDMRGPLIDLYLRTLENVGWKRVLLETITILGT